MNLIDALMGSLPFVLLFCGLAFTRIRSYFIALAVLGVTLVSSHFFWNTPGVKLLEACLEGTVTALVPIIWVIFGAVFSYIVSVETGGIEVIKNRLTHLTDDHRVQAVLVAFCFGGFLEAIAGFGTAVAIPSAMLITLGFAAVPAITISLVANSVPVAFGALGIPVIALAKVTNLSVDALTKLVALQLLPFAILVPVGIAAIANWSPGKKAATPFTSVLPGVLVIGSAFSLVQTLIAFFIGPELVAVGGSLAAFAAYLLYRRIQVGKRILSSENLTDAGELSLSSATTIYLILLVLVILTRFASETLKSPPFAVLIPVGKNGVTVDYLSTPGTLLVLATLIGGKLLGVSFHRLGALAWETAFVIRYSALTILLILMIAKAMSVSGMIVAVAAALAALAKGGYPLLAPVIGAIGTFVTGSDTSSNVLLGELQKQTAIKTGFSPEWLAAANTSGASAGKMISPQSIQIAASVVGEESRQGEILRKNISYCALYLALAGIFVAAVAWF